MHAAKKHIVLSLVHSKGVPEEMRTDEKRLQQIMLNLLVNAVKYTPNGKRIAIKLLQDPLDSQMLIFQVADEGIGMPFETKMALFKLFGTGAERETQGTGRKRSKVGLDKNSRFRSHHHEHVVSEARKGATRRERAERRDHIHVLSAELFCLHKSPQTIAQHDHWLWERS
jgi:signal transduction histidine kinase